MNANLTRKRWKAVATLALLLASLNAFAGDAVVASFDRMVAQQADPAGDAVAGSFARMFAHTPGTTAPAAPAGFGPDPLTAAIVEPLRKHAPESTHVASGCGPATH